MRRLGTLLIALIITVSASATVSVAERLGIPVLGKRTSTKAIAQWIEKTRKSTDYSSWLNDFEETVSDFLFHGSDSYENSVRLMLAAKPPGGGEQYGKFLNNALEIIDDYIFHQNDQYLKAMEFYTMAKPGKIPQGHYISFLSTLNEYMDDYCFHKSVPYKNSLEALKDIRPPGNESDYSAWFKIYTEYLDDFNFHKTDEYKYCCDTLVSVKPGGPAIGDADLVFLENIDETSKSILENKDNVREFINLIANFKEGLVRLALDGAGWARDEYDRLKGIFGIN